MLVALLFSVPSPLTQAILHKQSCGRSILLLHFNAGMRIIIIIIIVRAASHPPVWIHRNCESRSLKKMLNGLCWDDDYTIAQWLEHHWLQARVPGSSPGGDSQFFLQTFPVCLFPSNQLIFHDLGLPAC